MGVDEHEVRRFAPPGAHQPDWSRLRDQATDALLAVFRARGELSPDECARVVAGALPPRLGRWLLAWLSALGWRAPDAVVSCDALDEARCPPPLRGPARDLFRLAVLGLPGQGLAWRDKHRHDIYQRLCAEIMSYAVDTTSLHAVASRALNHPDVSGDSTLAAMLRGFIAEREAALRAARSTPAEDQRRREQASKLHSGFGRKAYPSGPEIRERFARLQREFDSLVAQFEETRAARALDALRDLRRQFPVHVPAAELQRAEEQYDHLCKNAGAYRRQVKELATRGAAAARAGEMETAGWIIRRLEAIHALLPNLLPVQELQALRAEISRCTDEHETEEAIHELVARKRQVAEQIKRLAGVVHRYHELAARLPADDPACRRAELNYRKAVQEIRALDTEWLSGLVVELETYLRDLDDPEGIMQDKLDRFIANVRTALNRLCLEIRAHQRNRRPPPSACPPEGPPEA